MFSDFGQPAPAPFPGGDVQFGGTGPDQPFFSSDDNGKVLFGGPLVAQGGMTVGDAPFPPPTSSAVPQEIPTFQLNGLLQANSLLVSDGNSNPVFYTTSSQPP